MLIKPNGELASRIESFLNRIGQRMPRATQRESFAIYAHGLLSDLERKSAEPIAALVAPEAADCQRMHDNLLYFLKTQAWQDRAVRLEAARYGIEALSVHGPVVVWIVDDTGFLKQGKHSVGVQRQYTGSAGKVTNCQIGVSLSVATGNEQLPIDFELYLPHSWTDNAARRDEAHIPEHVVFKTKGELALDMIDRAAAAGIPGEVILADAGYGDSVLFRQSVRLLGFDYGLAIHAPTTVWLLNARGEPQGQAIGAQQLGVKLGRRAFHRLSWRDSSSGRKLSGKFCFRRVRVAADDGSLLDQREELWLMMEWLDDQPKPTKFVLTTMPRRMSKKQIVRIVKERWRTERAYEEMKGELGLDHFEGRSFPAWHHHVSVVLCCYAFVVAERARSFSPSASRASASGALQSAA